MNQGKFINQQSFWRFWLGGLVLFAIIIALNPQLTNEVAPRGIASHQVAGSAAAVDAIHAAWARADVTKIAILNMVLDLIFIAVYSAGAFIGGLLFRRMPSFAMMRLGGVIAVSAIIFALTDYAETICQLIQLSMMQGSDRLAAIAAFANPIKSIAFLFTFLGILLGLLLQHRLNKPTP